MCCGCAGGSRDEGGAPGAPTGVTAQAGSATSVHVMWNAVTADPAVSAYEVYRGSEKVREVPGSAHMLDVVRLSPSTTYVFTVRARDGDGRLGPSGRLAGGHGSARRSRPLSSRSHADGAVEAD
ncbi:fibronectin type III domain-containing protein, partial [Streptomyces sp. NPDC052127]|uniref:fibronectin type III domain-containing protein n=1 Tax=Streptomyces sp. NPDC052127 TaxID=3155679 RepID=UPI003442EE4E